MGYLAVLAGCEVVSTETVQVHSRLREFNAERVVVLPFEEVPVDQEREEHFGWWRANFRNNGEVISNILSTELMAITDFEFIERSQIRKILDEHKLSLSDMLEKGNAPEIGKMLGAESVVLGQVHAFNWEANILGMSNCVVAFSARMVHVETGTILWSTVVQRRGGHRDCLGLAKEECQKIVKALRAKIPPGG